MRTTLKIRSLTTFFVVYVIALSFIPLVHQTFAAQSSWLGYGTGAYAFQSPNDFVLFNDPYDGSSKPNIHVNPSFAPNERISLVEFSDWTSYVNGYNLFNDFNVTMTTSNSKILDVTYTLTPHPFFVTQVKKANKRGMFINDAALKAGVLSPETIVARALGQ